MLDSSVKDGLARLAQVFAEGRANRVLRQIEAQKNDRVSVSLDNSTTRPCTEDHRSKGEYTNAISLYYLDNAIPPRRK